MQDYQERVVKEKAELDEKIAKLDAFQNTAIYETLPGKEHDLLYQQFCVMREYSYILGERIARF